METFPNHKHMEIIGIFLPQSSLNADFGYLSAKVDSFDLDKLSKVHLFKGLLHENSNHFRLED